MQALNAGVNAILHPRFRSPYHDHGIGGFEAPLLPRAVGATAMGGANGAERGLNIADVLILDIEA